MFHLQMQSFHSLTHRHFPSTSANISFINAHVSSASAIISFIMRNYLYLSCKNLQHQEKKLHNNIFGTHQIGICSTNTWPPRWKSVKTPKVRILWKKRNFRQRIILGENFGHPLRKFVKNAWNQYASKERKVPPGDTPRWTFWTSSGEIC